MSNYLDELLGNLLAPEDGATENSFATTIYQGETCSCGPGFCWADAGLGGMGYCRGGIDESLEPGPNCPVCQMPHQQAERPCWFCDGDQAKAKDASAWRQLLEHGVSASEAFDFQDSSESPVSFRESVRVVCERKRTETE